MDRVYGGLVAACACAWAGGAWAQTPSPAAPSAPQTPAATGNDQAPQLQRITPEPAHPVEPATSKDYNQAPPATIGVSEPAPEVRPWRLIFGLGGAWVNGGAFGNLLQSGYLDQTNFDVGWQPGPVGLDLGLAWFSSSETHSGVSSHYQSTEARLAATYMLPIPRDSWQVILYAGVLRAIHRLHVDDGFVTIGNNSDNYGPLVGVDFGTPTASGLRLLLRLEWAEQHMKFAEFDFDHKLVERRGMLGVSYEF